MSTQDIDESPAGPVWVANPLVVPRLLELDFDEVGRDPSEVEPSPYRPGHDISALGPLLLDNEHQWGPILQFPAGHLEASFTQFDSCIACGAVRLYGAVLLRSYVDPICRGGGGGAPSGPPVCSKKEVTVDSALYPDGGVNEEGCTGSAP
jgi:hypothetical protein